MRPPVDRPTCPFEQAEYTAVVTDALRRTQNHHQNAWGLHLAHLHLFFGQKKRWSQKKSD